MMDDRPPVERRQWVGASVVVLLAVLVNAVVFRGQLRSATTGSDMAAHRAVVDWALEQMRSGHTPFDGWMPRFGLGFPVMHQYQSLPHQITALLAWGVGVGPAMRITTYALLVTWPVTIFVGLRIMRIAPAAAAAAAAIAPWLISEPGYGYEAGSYVWRGLGVWPQLWAMWVLPLALGLAWRAVNERRHLTLAAISCGLVICLHLQTGYALLLVVVLAVFVRRDDLLRRAGAAAAVGIGALASSAWLLVPALSDQQWTAASQYNEGSTFADSYGASQVLKWLLSGELFDDGRLPLVTAAVAVGLVMGLRRWRHDPQARWLISGFGLSLVLFCGRESFGPVIDAVPGIDSLYLHRFIAGVQFYGLVLAAIGVVELFQLGRGWLVRSDPSPNTAALATGIGLAVGVLGLVVVSAPVREFERVDREWMAEQRIADATDGAAVDRLVDQAIADSPGRFYAGMLATNGGNYFVGYARTQSRIQQAGPTDVLGFSLRVPAFLADVEVLFDETNPAHYELFNVRWVIQPTGRAVPPNGELVALDGRHELYRITNSGGYLRVVDTQGAIPVERNTIQEGALALLARTDLDAPFPLLSFDGRQTPEPSLLFGLPDGAPGELTEARIANEVGFFEGDVQLKRAAVVVLKASYHPRMTAKVDGVAAPVQLVAPGFAGVSVPAGNHTVTFAYDTYDRYWLWALVALAVLLSLAAGETWRNSRPPAEPFASTASPERNEHGLSTKDAFLAELDAREAARAARYTALIANPADRDPGNGSIVGPTRGGSADPGGGSNADPTGE